MSDVPVGIVVVADLRIAKVQSAWSELEAVLRAMAGLEILAVDFGDLDYSALSAELAVVIGGDGAILRACRHMGQWQIPIIGVNMGRLGFLADLSLAEFQQAIPQILARQYRVTQYLMFECTLTPAQGPRQVLLGLNEVVVSAASAMKMIDVHLAIDGEAVTAYSCDGLIVSTPVGSTAHSLSAGGPILRQDLQAFVITPICPHTLTMRPLVDSADCLYTLTVPDIPEGVNLIVDGQLKLPLSSGDRIDIRRAGVQMRVAKVPGSSYYATLHRKLSWGGQPNYRLK